MTAFVHSTSGVRSLQGNTERRTELLHFAVQTQHRMARLLGVTRWAKEYGTCMDAAMDMETRYNARTKLLDDTADCLWSMHTQSIKKPEPVSELGAAVDALTTGTYKQFPRLPGLSIGIEESVSMDDDLQGSTFSGSSRSPVSEGTQRLGLATRSTIRESIGFLDGIDVVAWRVGAADVCVRIGVPGLWAASISLDGLDSKTAVFRCHQLSIFVASDLDAIGALPKHSTPSDDENHYESMRSSISPTEESMLCRLADDRMAEAAAAAASAAVSMGTPVDRMQVMLSAFREMLSVEVCAPLVMGHLRSQAQALTSSTWGDVIEVQGYAPDTPRKTPITIQYWKDSRSPASLTIAEYRGSKAAIEEARQSIMAIDQGAMARDPPDEFSVQISKRKLIVITHNPPLPGYAGKDYFSFIEDETHCLNLEKLIEASIRVRSSVRLLHIAEAVLQHRKSLKVHSKCLTLRSTCMGNEERVQRMGTRVSFSPSSDEALIIHLHADRCTGLDIRVSARTGGLRVRPFGAASLSVPNSKRHQKSLTWSGHRQLQSKSEEESIVTQVLLSVRSNCSWMRLRELSAL